MNTTTKSGIAVQEGYLPFRGYRVWYRIVGSGEKKGQLPLLVLHGGPGIPHDYLEPLEEIASTGRRVIFYDQLGCGNSDHPKDKSLWTVNLFLDELRAVRAHLALDRFHLLGHCWGGMLAMEYAVTHPQELKGLIISNTTASMTQFVDGVKRLRAQLPQDVQDTLTRFETSGKTDDKQYQDAAMVFYRKHLCRVDPWPEYLTRALDKAKDSKEVYYTMKGPSELVITGTLKNWDIRNRLGSISIPTMVIGGRFDAVMPEAFETIHRSISGSELVMFENSSHCPHVEETARYIQVVNNFIGRVEANIQETERIEAAKRAKVAA